VCLLSNSLISKPFTSAYYLLNRYKVGFSTLRGLKGPLVPPTPDTATVESLRVFKSLPKKNPKSATLLQAASILAKTAILLCNKSATGLQHATD
jgi:hypothetical protein